MKSAVILAGGRGKRLGNLTKDIPKPLIEVGGKPVIVHQILLLRRYGIKNIWILSGYLGNKINEFIGNGAKWGVNIRYLVEKNPLGTAGAIKTLQGVIKDDFLVFSGDVILDVDLNSFLKFHKKNAATVTIAVHPTDHPFDSDLVEVKKNDQISKFHVRPHSKNLIFRNLSIASIFVLNSRIMNYIPSNLFTDLEKDILPKLLKSGERIFAYKTAEYIKDMGTPERMKMVDVDIRSGLVQKLNSKNKRKAIFLDRDGTINEDVPFLTRLEEMTLFPFTARAVKKINASEYLAIVITNQATISMGKMDEDQLNNIHKKLESELGKQGVKLDAIYYCPHYPESGYVGEIKELKIRCACRKPKIGMIKQAARDFNIDLSKSLYIGDTSVDLETARNAGLKFIGVETAGSKNERGLKKSNGIILEKNLLSAVNLILGK